MRNLDVIDPRDPAPRDGPGHLAAQADKHVDELLVLEAALFVPADKLKVRSIR